jgi:sigma-B regulation protein RsbU (phosphoserine phosphatase)
MNPFLHRLRKFWRDLSRRDFVASCVLVCGVAALVAGASGGIFSYVKFLAILAAVYLGYRLLVWGRANLLWSLRSRLIVAYLFIAVVPILLLCSLAIRSAEVLYSQLGAYLLSEDINRRVQITADITEHIAAAEVTLPRGVTEDESERILAAQSHAVHDRELPGLTIEFSNDSTLLRKIPPAGRKEFAGLLQQEETLSIVSLREIQTSRGVRVIRLRIPVSPELLRTIAPDLGAIQLNLMQGTKGGQARGVVYSSGGMQYEATSRIVARNRTLQEPMLLDRILPIDVVSRLDSAYVGRDGSIDPIRPVLVVFNARPSRLNAKIFSSLGELRDTYLIAFVLVGLGFLLIEAAALATGIVLTLRITRAVNELYGATQFVQRGDFTHRVRVERRDQLGMLGESFNQMTGSISGLIEEQKKRQRLENEILIAREVQDQLFPRKLPEIPGLQIHAICKAARSVSGDYYDFIQLTPTHIAIAIADISGKGISAALLMASLQAALRSQVLVSGSEKMSTAELVSRLNLHMVRNTADDRFATFFVAVYDCETRLLRYTNAGHLPAFLICKDVALNLEEGGMVLGIMEDYLYEEGSATVPAGALFVGYSDGLVEPENVYGEEFGIRRLRQAAVHVQNETPQRVAESLMATAEEWAGAPEQADDMTVIVARLQ